ncbi:hypothetical protein NMY22_g17757 [Coprinellus aureogranulatus]|nr:hypothetical protein NMY22_g17757 [Coprinellus aureogranulatus]
MADDFVVAPFPFRRVGQAPGEVYLFHLNRPGVTPIGTGDMDPERMVYTQMQDQPACLNFAGTLEAFEAPPTLSFPGAFETRLNLTFAIMDSEGKAMTSETLHCFNQGSLDRLITFARDHPNGREYGVPDILWITEPPFSRLAIKIQTDFVFFKSAVPQSRAIDTPHLNPPPDSAMETVYRKDPEVLTRAERQSLTKPWRPSSERTRSSSFKQPRTRDEISKGSVDLRIVLSLQPLCRVALFSYPTRAKRTATPLKVIVRRVLYHIITSDTLNPRNLLEVIEKHKPTG